MTNVAHMEKKREREKINQELGKYFFTTLLVKDPSSLSTNTVKDHLPCLDLTLIITQFKLLAINTLALTEDTVPKKKSPFEIKSCCACALHLPTPCPLVALVTEKEGAHGQREGEVPGLLFT